VSEQPISPNLSTVENSAKPPTSSLTTQPVVELSGVAKEYSGITAVSGLDLALYSGRVSCLLGENGAGKSTVIKILTGVERPTVGQVLVRGTPVHFSNPKDARDQGIATVYQEVATLPMLSVARNFVLGAEPTIGWGPFQRIDLKRASEIALVELKRLGIRRVNSGSQLVGTLSGGERQALAIARAVHFGAQVLVLDEPTAALGVRESATVLRLI
jgi:simple sugar transport system ATP-binding protein